MEKTTYELFGKAEPDCACIWESEDGQGWVLVTPCPACQEIQNQKNIEVKKQRRRDEIIVELNQLDQKAIRPLIDNETAKIEEIKTQKTILREELASLATTIVENTEIDDLNDQPEESTNGTNENMS